MKINSLLNIFSSVCAVGSSLQSEAASCFNKFLEDKVIKGKYVTREEFKILQQQYTTLLNQSLKNNELKYNKKD